jgi:hypothetical protein
MIARTLMAFSRPSRKRLRRVVYPITIVTKRGLFTRAMPRA